VMRPLGGLPTLVRSSGRSVLRHRKAQPVGTSKEAFVDLLKRKGFWMRDLEDHPVCLGVPLGRDMGLGGAMQVDIGLKNPATVSLADLMDASPQLKHAMLERAAQGDIAKKRPDDPALMRDAAPVPMAVLVKEDLQRLPVASPVHPDALESKLSPQQLEVLSDPFFKVQEPANADLIDFATEAVPGMDAHVASKRDYRRERRAEFRRLAN